MATPAQQRKERKAVLRVVKSKLRTMDGQNDKLNRQLARILRIKKRLPDMDDAAQILAQLRVIDKSLDAVIAEATTFSQFVRTS